MKSEGLEFLYNICNSMGWDNLDLADLEIILAVIREFEKLKVVK